MHTKDDTGTASGFIQFSNRSLKKWYRNLVDNKLEKKAWQRTIAGSQILHEIHKLWMKFEFYQKQRLTESTPTTISYLKKETLPKTRAQREFQATTVHSLSRYFNILVHVKIPFLNCFKRGALKSWCLCSFKLLRIKGAVSGHQTSEHCKHHLRFHFCQVIW